MAPAKMRITRCVCDHERSITPPALKKLWPVGGIPGTLLPPSKMVAGKCNSLEKFSDRQDQKSAAIDTAKEALNYRCDHPSSFTSDLRYVVSPGEEKMRKSRHDFC